MTKTTLLLTSALSVISGLAWSTVAAAQTAPTSGTSATEVGAVIVTAEKRSQNLQKVPVAVTAFTTKQRDVIGIENLQDMTNFTPGLVYNSVDDRVALRGIGRQTNLLSAEAAVSTYVDGFFTTSAVEASKPPMFVSNIEVLRGPQGTLQGRNSIGGALLVTTARPTAVPYAEVRITEGNYGYTDVQAAISGPLTDGLKFRVQGYYDQQNQGYFKNLANGATEGGNLNQYYIEPSVSAKLGDNADLYVKAFTARWNNISGPGARSNYTSDPYGNQLNDLSNQSLFNAAAPYYTANYLSGVVLPGSFNQTNPNITNNPAATNIRDFSTNTREFVHLTNSYDFDAEFTYHFPTFDVKYVGGFQSYKYDLDVDADGTDVNSYTIPNVFNPSCAAAGAPCLTIYPTWNYFYEENNQWFSHEVTFASTTNSPLQWIGGLYYYDEHYSNPIITTDPQQSQLTNPYQLLPILGPGEFIHTTAANPNNYVTYQNYQMETRSEAVYGQLDWKATDTLKLTGGLRYTADHKDGTEYERLVFFGGSILGALYAPGAFTGQNAFDPNLNGLLGGFGVPQVGAVDVTSCPTPLAGAKGIKGACFINAAGMAQRAIGDDFSGTTGTAGLEWTPTSDTLGYLRYSRGYKAGGFNAGNLSAAPETKPEFVNSYEVGLKKSFGRELVVDAAIYYYDFQDAQFPVTTPVLIPGGNGASQNESLLTNIPKTRSDGFELESIWTPIDHLQLNLSYSFNDTSIVSGCSSSGGVFNGLCLVDTNDPLGQFSGARVIGTLGGEAVQSVKGNQLPNAPRNKVSLNTNYTFVFDTGSLTFSGTYIWRDQQYGAVFKEPYDVAPSWSQVDLRATWKGKGDRYEVALYGRNVFNTVGYASAAPGLIYSTGAAANDYKVATDYRINPPATYGVELHYKFF
jgi:iron complex outermembrane receptor protein